MAVQSSATLSVPSASSASRLCSPLRQGCAVLRVICGKARAPLWRGAADKHHPCPLESRKTPRYLLSHGRGGPAIKPRRPVADDVGRRCKWGRLIHPPVGTYGSTSPPPSG